MTPLWEKQLLLLQNEFKAEAKSGYFIGLALASGFADSASPDGTSADVVEGELRHLAFEKAAADDQRLITPGLLDEDMRRHATGKDAREWLTAQARGDAPWPQRGEELASILMANATPTDPPAENGDALPMRSGKRVVIRPDELRVNDEVCSALATEPDLYQRGGQLVIVVEQLEEAYSEAPIRRPIGAPVLRLLTPALLRERLTRCAQFVELRKTEDGIVERQEHPPHWCTSAVFDRGQWQEVPYLEAIVTHPAFLQDGSLLSATGYNPTTRLFLSLEANLKVEVPEHPTSADVARAVETWSSPRKTASELRVIGVVTLRNRPARGSPVSSACGPGCTRSRCNRRCWPSLARG